MRQPEFWAREDGLSRFARTALSPVGWLYGESVAMRGRLSNPLAAPARVVCVGGLTAGGSGKTPVAIAIAIGLKERGARAFFLSRGYGGRSKGPVLVDRERHTAPEVGDEPLLLASVAPTVVSRDRRAGAALAIARGADIIVMDDGHQNFQLAKDLSVVVLDGNRPFGNGFLLPAGPLREPAAQGLSRADAIVVVGPGSPNLGRTARPIFRARIEPAPASSLDRRRLFAFAGIGEPERFFNTLRELGADLAATTRFPDHHTYRAGEFDALVHSAKEAGATLITTEKDFARLSPDQRKSVEPLPIRAAFDDGLDRLLDRVIANKQT